VHVQSNPQSLLSRHSAIKLNLFGDGRVGIHLRYAREPTEVFKGKNARAMAITPDGLNGILTDNCPPLELKGGGRERLDWPAMECSHHIALALASRARTFPAQFLQRDKAFLAIFPFDGQFPSDLLQVRWAHEDTLSDLTRRDNERLLNPTVGAIDGRDYLASTGFGNLSAPGF
jgi:hypothetical protein